MYTISQFFVLSLSVYASKNRHKLGYNSVCQKFNLCQNFTNPTEEQPEKNCAKLLKSEEGKEGTTTP